METELDKPLRRAQRVRYGRPDDLPAGMRVFNPDDTEEEFIPWAALKTELEKKLLPQLFADPSGFTLETRAYHGKQDWLVQIVDQRGEAYCDVWLGGDPENNYAFDGLVRVGDPDTEPYVWHTYQRFSDGGYVRVFAITPTIDSLTRLQRR